MTNPYDPYQAASDQTQTATGQTHSWLDKDQVPEPPQGPPMPSPSAHPPQPHNTAFMVMLGVVLLSVIGAIIFAFPQLSQVLSPTSRPQSGSGSDAKNASYVNGAKHEWTLNLPKEFPDIHKPTFYFTGDLEDPDSNFRYGVVSQGNTWVASVIDREAWSRSELRGFLIGIDAASGKIKWKTPGWSTTCYPGPGVENVSCLLNDHVVLVNVNSGQTKQLLDMPKEAYLVVAGDVIVIADPRSDMAYGVTREGKKLWQTSLPSGFDFPLGIPMSVSGNSVIICALDQFLSVDPSDGRLSAGVPDPLRNDTPSWASSYDEVTNVVEPGRVILSHQYNSPVIKLHAAESGSVLAQISKPDWQPMYIQPGRMVLMHSQSHPSGHSPVHEIASYAPVAPGEPSDFQVVGGPTRQEAPSVIPSCPSGSIQLAYAVFSDDWWVLVCGVDAEHPSVWISHVQGKRFESSSVRFESSERRYVATMSDGGRAWLSSAPGMAAIADAQGRITASRSGGIIVFVTLPSQASPSTGTGAYGVPVPAATAEDQVRYLDQILAKSAEGRAKLQPAVVAVRECSRGRGGDYSGEVAVIASVTQNRKDLLAALQTAPVDQVPDGVSLVNELTTALGYSLSADQEYEAWARAVQSSGCGAGSEARGGEYSKQASAAKITFVNHWNSLIVPKFGVSTQDQGKL